MNNISVNLEIQIPDKDLSDIVITAIESGIGYWACLDNTGEEFENAPKDECISETVARLLLEGKEITFLDDEDHNVIWHLNLEKLLKGIGLYLFQNPEVIDTEDKKIAIESIDAIAADCIFQYSLFDELVYG